MVYFDMCPLVYTYKINDQRDCFDVLWTTNKLYIHLINVKETEIEM